MLVDINLLPKKEPGNSAVIAVVVAAVLMVAAVCGLVFWQGKSDSIKINSTDKKINRLQEQAAALQDKHEESSAERLEKAVEWAESTRTMTVPLLESLITLLPERGFIRNFQYKDSESVTVNVRMDDTRSAAYYLHSLEKADWVDRADLLYIKAERDKKEKASKEPQNNKSNILPRYSVEYSIFLKKDYFLPKHKGSGRGGE